ncbi:MAG: alkaline phosphatase family protein [Halobacteriovoraceae bacterium]|nr:alkaline phosphatase family protein [Halobacteriovoraceae bacterium]
MKNYKKLSLFLILTTLLWGCSTTKEIVKTDPTGLQTNSELAMKKPYVIMISIDGFRHDYIKMYKPPFLSSMVDKGIKAKSLISTFPSKTFPNHYSLATGMHAGNHGLVANRFYDPQWKEAYQIGDSSTTTNGKWYGGSPLWLSVRNQGMMSSSFFWVGSDANIKGHYPNYYVPYDGRIENKTRVNQTLKWLKMPESRRPHYLTLYFSDVDSAGHRYGPFSQEVESSVLEIDKQISNLYDQVQKLNLKVNFVVVSDHGMMAIDNSKKVYLNEYIDPSKAIFKERGPITFIYMNDIKDLNSFKKKLKAVPHTKVYERKELPKKFHMGQNPRAGDLILLADPGAYIYPNKKRPETPDHRTRGTHGYDPILTNEMGGLFLSFGPTVKKKGVIKSFKNIHVYPFVMKLLELEVKNKIDGKLSVLKPFLIDNP